MVSLLPMLWPFAPEVARPIDKSFRRLRRSAPWLMAVLGLAAAFLLLGAYSPPTVAVDPTAASQAAEVEFIAELELFRGAPLVVDADLTRTARRWAQTMSETGLGHSELTPHLERWNYVGENVGMGESANEVFAALVGSASHRINMEDTRFTHVGVGAFVDSSGIIWTAHLFAGGERGTNRTPPSGP